MKILKAIESTAIQAESDIEDLTADNIDAWKPPTPDHEGLKAFMREQIESSIRFDCDNSYYLTHMPVKMTAMEWRSKQVEQARRDIAYHSKEHTEEVGRAHTRTDWVKALRESLSLSARIQRK